MFINYKKIVLISFISLLSACQSTSNDVQGPSGEIDNSKWKDSSAWASGSPTWTYEVLNVYDSSSMEMVYEKGLFDFSSSIELPPGEYLVKNHCYFYTPSSANTELYKQISEHEVKVIDGKVVTFDFELNNRVCKLRQRMF